MKLFSFVFILFAFHPLVFAEDAELTILFEQDRVNGTMIISSLKTDTVFVHNAERAKTYFSTASTFKILNSLIAIEEGVISNANSQIEWDGKVHQYPPWNSNQTLSSAFKVSCVWCYQKIAEQVGAEKYKHYISHIGYGKRADNLNTTGFWLDNSLTITAEQQVEFLKDVYTQSLDFGQKAYQVLSDIMIEETNDSFVLRGKTGWAASVTPQVGWYVGYVESKADVWFFATNIEITDNSDLQLRKKLTLSALRMKEIIDF